MTAETAPTLASPCTGTTGHHVCVTCSVAFRNNLDATRHEREHPYHQFAWMCPEHGLEASS